MLQDPLLAVSVWPCCAVPLIVGNEVFAGGGGFTVCVLLDVAEPDPPSLVAVTTTSIVSPTSELWRA